MKQYKTLGVVKSYQITQFLYDKLSMEDNYPTDMHDDKCYDDLYARVDAQARRKYPHLFASVHPNAIYPLEPKDTYNGTAVPEWAKEHKQVATASYSMGVVFMGIPTEEDIRACSNLEHLEQAFFPAIDKLPAGEEKTQLWLIYDEVYSKLKKEPA